jgi:hypothetical protein
MFTGFLLLSYFDYRCRFFPATYPIALIPVTSIPVISK